MVLKDILHSLSLKSNEYKIRFTEFLLQEITVMNRVLWDNPDVSSQDIVESLKWSNELTHRIWGLLFELRKGAEDNFEDRLRGNIVFYIKQSEELKKYLPSTIQTAIERCDYNI